MKIEPMVVASVLPSISRQAGGLFNSVRELNISCLENGRIAPRVIALRDQYSDADAVEWLPIEPKLSASWGPASFGFSPALLSDCRDSAIHLLHSHGVWMFTSLATRLASQARNIPYVLSPHGMLDPWALDHSRRKKYLALVAFERKNIMRASCIRVLCDAEGDAVRKFGYEGPICKIPNGVFIPDKATISKSQPFGPLEAGRKILLFLGRIHSKKGLAELVSAWKGCGDTGQWHLVIAGWGSDNEVRNLERSIAEAGSRTISYIGPQFGEDKRACFEQAHAFVLPSYSEGLPVAVLEAWSYGLPVLMTEECNLPEGFATGAARQIEVDPSALEKNLSYLFDASDAELLAMGETGLRLVKDRFSWNRISDSMIDLYEFLIGRGPPPSDMLCQ